MKVNIRKISECTGFSPATISNALNHKKGVNSETAKKIFCAAVELGYRTDKAQTKIKFVTYRKNGLIIDDSQIFPAMIEGVERQAKELGYETAYAHLNCQDSFFMKHLNEMLEDTTSIMILLGTEMQEEDFALFQNYKGYMIVLDGWSEEMLFDAIVINNTDAAKDAVEYLIKKGHTEIGYLKGDCRIKAFQHREYGYERALKKYGIDRKKEYEVLVGTKLETSYQKMKEYLKESPRLPSAFFADNDVIALGALRALKEKNIEVPKRVSLIGFDDISFATVSAPGLTTLKVFKQEMGEAAVRRALDHVIYSGKEVRMKIQVCTEFIERTSVQDKRERKKDGGRKYGDD